CPTQPAPRQYPSVPEAGTASATGRKNNLTPSDRLRIALRGGGPLSPEPSFPPSTPPLPPGVHPPPAPPHKSHHAARRTRSDYRAEFAKTARDGRVHRPKTARHDRAHPASLPENQPAPAPRQNSCKPA